MVRTGKGVMMINQWGASVCAVALTTLGVAGLAAQQQLAPSARDGRAGGPSEAMLQACVAKTAEQSCSVPGLDGASMPGTCRAPQNLPLACVPEGAGPGGPPGGARGGPPSGPPGGGGQGAGGPPPPQSNTGTELPATRAYTNGVLCDRTVDALNPQINLRSQSKWACERGQRTLTANGVPDHAVGEFPNPANPNRIAEQTVRFAVTTTPVASDGPGGQVKEPVMGLNGVKFDPGTGGSCQDDVTSARQCGLGPGSGGQWRIEALGQDSFDFGEDENHAHVQPDGTYHYHGVPDGMLSPAAKAGQEMALIGWAADGFPVYARYGYAKANVMTGALTLMRPSYRLKSAPDAGRPDVAVVPMGAFQQDWEYVEGLGDLDECNGRIGSTPEFPTGIYHYYATDAYPYVQRCVKGSVDSQAWTRERPSRPGRDGRGGGGGGGRPPRGDRR